MWPAWFPFNPQPFANKACIMGDSMSLQVLTLHFPLAPDEVHDRGKSTNTLICLQLSINLDYKRKFWNSINVGKWEQQQPWLLTSAWWSRLVSFPRFIPVIQLHSQFGAGFKWNPSTLYLYCSDGYLFKKNICIYF